MTAAELADAVERSVPGGVSQHADGVDMPTLARFLSEGRTGRPVIDETGIAGKFDFRLEWTPDPSLDPAHAASQTPPSDAGISVFTALPPQLGLKLESTKGPVKVLVVDSAQKGSPD